MTLTRPPGPLATARRPRSTTRSTVRPTGCCSRRSPAGSGPSSTASPCSTRIDGGLVHESNLLPVLYVPDADVDMGLLEPTDHSTHCPFKGDASYWSVRVGDRVAENAVWAYHDPIDGARVAARPRGVLLATGSTAGSTRTRRSSGTSATRTTASTCARRAGPSRCASATSSSPTSTRAMVLSETGLPNRWYVPADDVRAELLVPSVTIDALPVQGRRVVLDVPHATGVDVADVAWSYEQPFDDVQRIAGYRSFLGDDVTVEVADALVRAV